MPLTVLSVAYPLTYVGPDAVGGSEQILALLDRALTDAGHRSLVIAAEGSEVHGTLIPSPVAKGPLDQDVREHGQKLHLKLIRETLSKYSVDLVHMHSLDFHQYLPPPGIPTLATLHLPPNWYPPHIFRMRRQHFYLNCVSQSQRKACPESRLLLPVIPNGVNVHRLMASEPKKNYALSLGRICPEKEFHLGLEACRQAGVDFLLAGEVFPYAHHEQYFQKEIAPRLNKHRRFIGPVDFETKKNLLAQAKCLLVTSSVPETSSLVAMEALAAGTPVIAFPVGALPEIVDDGRTGYLVTSVREMAKAIRAVDKIDSGDCRNAARRRFTAEKMVEGYTDAYRHMIARRSGEAERPRVMSATSWLVSW
jgi:glycosyltransferase involved in cell wall biosynthesis